MRFMNDGSLITGHPSRRAARPRCRDLRREPRPPKSGPVVIGWTVLLLLLASTACSFAGDEDFGSALLVGVGGAYAAAPGDAAVIWLNPAMVALARGRGELSISYRRLFELETLEELHASVRHRVGRVGTVGVGFARFGESGLYQESRGIFTLARRLKRGLAAGVGIQYERVEFGDNSHAASGASLDIGAALHPWGNTLVGLAVRNVSLDGTYPRSEDDRPVLVESSVAWSLPPDITIAGILSKEDGRDARFGVGQRLRVARHTEFLSGLRFDPIRYTLGGRLGHQRGALDYVYQSHPDLGGTHTIGASWRW